MNQYTEKFQVRMKIFKALKLSISLIKCPTRIHIRNQSFCKMSQKYPHLLSVPYSKNVQALSLVLH